MTALYRQAFPDFDHDLVVPDGFEDTSSHNDACPSLCCGDTTLFVDYKDPAKRETTCSDATYCAVFHWHDGDNETIYEGEDFTEAVAACRAVIRSAA